MKSKILLFKSVAALSLVAAFGLTACGSDSEPVAPVVTPASSTSAPTSASTLITSSAENQEPGIIVSSSSESLVHCDALIPECGYSAEYLCTAGIAEYCNAQSSSSVELPCSDPVDNPAISSAKFNDIGDVYKNTKCNEKVVFIIRHGERESFIGSESALTEDGFDAAIKAGQKLIGPEKFRYIFSGMTRTKQTAMGIAAGRGEITYQTAYTPDADGAEHLDIISPEFTADTITQLKDGWYIKDKAIRDAYVERDTIKNVNVMYTAWAYDGTYADAFYDLEERSLELIDLLVGDYASMPKYTLAASHDQVLAPLAIWASNKQIDLKLHAIDEPPPRNWLNYLAGVAIIINDQNQKRYLPIKGMDDVIMSNGTVVDGGTI